MGKPKIVNIVATGQFSQPLDLEKLYRNLDVEEKFYDPEVYPALLVKVGKNRHHITLFGNGKYIIAGVSTIEQLNDTYKEILRKLRKIEALKK